MNTLLFSRKNSILSTRARQLELNQSALIGGRDYINKRLWRAPNESDISWNGGGTDNLVGRLQRASLENSAGRIASKINQYLFGKKISRSGINEEWALSVTTKQQSINEFWQEVSEIITACGWCWLQADRLRKTDEVRTLADKERDGDVVRWKVWQPLTIPDWCFDENGNLQWLLTSEEEEDNSDPLKNSTLVFTRTLWRRNPSGATFQRWQMKSGEDNSGVELVDEGSISSPEVPFVLIGNPSKKPWWFDDVEMVQAQILNLDSLHYENLVRTVFPQLIIPETMLLTLETRLVERAGNADGKKIMEAVREVVRGLDTPLVESAEDRGVTRFIQPSFADLQAIPTERALKRKTLFEQVGLSLFNKESRQMESAESKQFDHLDTEATLRHRAKILEVAEDKLVRISKKLDSSFADYKAEWSQDFNVTDFLADSSALSTLTNVGEPTLTQRKLIQKAVTKLLGSVIEITDDEEDQINSEIDSMEDVEFSPLTDRYGKNKNNQNNPKSVQKTEDGDDVFNKKKPTET